MRYLNFHCAIRFIYGRVRRTCDIYFIAILNLFPNGFNAVNILSSRLVLPNKEISCACSRDGNFVTRFSTLPVTISPGNLKFIFSGPNSFRRAHHRRKNTRCNYVIKYNIRISYYLQPTIVLLIIAYYMQIKINFT